MTRPEVISELTGLGFPEALRWRDGSLWFSDMFRGKVIRWQPGSVAETVIDQSAGGPEMPGGLGWLPDRALLVVDCLQRKLICWREHSGLQTYADLSTETRYPLNDMFVAADGTAWVGGYGFDPEHDTPVASPVYLVSQDRRVSQTPSTFVFPNGTERFGSHIAIAETFADRVSFTNERGEIIGKQDWPTGSGPDGLSYGPDGSLYVASAFTGSLDVLDPQGQRSNLVSLAAANRRDEAGGPRGIFDCAAHPEQPIIAYSSAVLDETYAMRHDTGSITLLRLGT